MLEPVANSYRASFGHRSFVPETVSAPETINDQYLDNDQSQGYSHDPRPLVSLVIPAHNEALIIEQNLGLLCDYIESLEAFYRWEIVVVNDGSIDDTRQYAEAFARTRQNVLVIHHLTNLGLGQALKSGFAHCRGSGDYKPDDHQNATLMALIT